VVPQPSSLSPQALLWLVQVAGMHGLPTFPLTSQAARATKPIAMETFARSIICEFQKYKVRVIGTKAANPSLNFHKSAEGLVDTPLSNEIEGLCALPH
jgi:hypothetical protein